MLGDFFNYLYIYIYKGSWVVYIVLLVFIYSIIGLIFFFVNSLEKPLSSCHSQVATVKLPMTNCHCHPATLPPCHRHIATATQPLPLPSCHPSTATATLPLPHAPIGSQCQRGCLQKSIAICCLKMDQNGSKLIKID
jgi:hypothetical protein